MQHDISSGNQKLQYDTEDKNTLTESHSSWTANSLAIQSQARARLDLKSGIDIRERDSAERGRSGVLRSGERMSSLTIFEIHLHGPGNSNGR